MSEQTQKSALTKINRDLEEKAAASRAKDLNMPYVEIAAFPVNPDVLRVIAYEDAVKGAIMPFFKSGKNIRVAVNDPDNAVTQAVLKAIEQKGFTVSASLASAEGISEQQKIYEIEKYKAAKETKNIVAEEDIHYERELANLASLKEKISGMPAEEALNMLHVSAIKSGASDIHYQPEEKFCAVRLRIDGVLHTAFDIEKDVFTRIAGQLKYKAGMKLNVSNVPQDGRFKFIVNDRKIDVRVSSLPTEFGEAFVCRILDSARHFESFEELGFRGQPLDILKQASQLTHGMVLVTGPTSSGKTTTLYVLLNRFNKPELKIITLEDPIEYHLKGLTQSQIDEAHGYSFADGLRSILRQDPDIVMVGEIRDLTTAQTGAQAALTGHVVLSTLHTNSAVETIPRLLALGMPAFIIAPALSVVIAQRLVRRLCQKCAVDKKTTEEEHAIIQKHFSGAIPENLKAVKGCEECNFTGFRGQMVIAEALDVTDVIEDAILKGAPSSEILSLARSAGMITMIEDAISKVVSGETTLSEVHRVINA